MPARRNAARMRWIGAVALALIAAPSAAVAADAADEAETTTTTVAYPVRGDASIYLLGEETPVSATVMPVGASGTVAFFDGDAPLGEAEVDDDGVAVIETDAWAGSGEREVTAHFVPDGDAYAPSESKPMSYRVVDTTRAVPDVAVGDAEGRIDEASFDWTIVNIWFSNFAVGFERDVVSGDVTLPEATPGTTVEEKMAYFSRPFTFQDGEGRTDADGNTVVSFSGAARLTSGTANEWVFTDPEIRLDADGDGYITAEFSGFYRLGAHDQAYGPTRVTIATFTGAERATSSDGVTTVETPLAWDGQARGVGTWANGFDASFPNEFVALLNPAVNLFFAASGVATDSSKEPLPITLTYREEEQAVPSVVASPRDVSVAEGEDAAFEVGVDSEATFEVRWQERRDGDWSDIPDATGERLVLPAVSAERDGSAFRAVVAGDGFLLESDAATLTVVRADAPDDDADPGDDDAGQGGEGSGDDGPGREGEATGGTGDGTDPATHAGDVGATERDAVGDAATDPALATTGGTAPLALGAAGILALAMGALLVVRRRLVR
ncbi:MAG: Ig-like domain-containing protein [Microbacterium sp.]